MKGIGARYQWYSPLLWERDKDEQTSLCKSAVVSVVGGGSRGRGRGRGPTCPPFLLVVFLHDLTLSQAMLTNLFWLC